MRRVLAIAVLLLAAQGAGFAQALQAVRQYREARAPEIVQQFAELLSIPNISSDLPNVLKNADYLAEQFGLRGIKMELLELPGVAPIVFGEIRVPGATRTLGTHCRSSLSFRLPSGVKLSPPPVIA
jgi:hypothetical protein